MQLFDHQLSEGEKAMWKGILQRQASGIGTHKNSTIMAVVLLGDIQWGVSIESAEYIPQVYRAQVWQKTQVSQGNSFSNILITGNAPVRSRYET